MKPVKISIKENINLYYNPTKKFKTTTLGVYIHRPLSREECTLNSLLCMVMRRGCPGFEDSKTLSRYLDNLYGMGFWAAKAVTMAKHRARMDRDHKPLLKLANRFAKQDEFVLDGPNYSKMSREAPH